MTEQFPQETDPELPGGGSSAPPARWPNPAFGPYVLNLDAEFDQASKEILSRSDIIDAETAEELRVTQEPPDLAAALEGQRAAILRDISRRQSGISTRRDDLQDHLLASVAGSDELSEQLRRLREGARSLADAVRLIGDEVPSDISSEKHDELEAWIPTIQNYSQELAGWAAPTSPSRSKRPPVLAPPQSSPRHQTWQIANPRSLAIAVFREQASCEQLMKTLEQGAVPILREALPLARNQREFRALEAEWEAQRRDLVRDLERLMVSAVLTAINSALSEASGASMRVVSFEGLQETVAKRAAVPTAAFHQLDKMIRNRPDGSFGIAGPRGVGKTALIRHFTTTPAHPTDGSEGEAGPPVERARLGVVVSAPVRYDAREFVLHLFAELCRRVAGKGADEAISAYRPEPNAWRVISPTAAIGVAVLAPWAAACGAGLLAWQGVHQFTVAGHPLARAGAGLLILAAALLSFVLFCAVRNVTELTRRIPLLAPGAERQRCVHRRSEVIKVRTRQAAGLSVVAVVGLIVLLVSGGWHGSAGLLAAGLGLLVAGSAASSVLFIRPPLWSPPADDKSIRDEPLPPPSGDEASPHQELRDLALVRLREIRVQQRFSSERSTTVSITGPSALPVGIEVEGKQGASWEDRPKTYPELVADLQLFLAAVGGKHEVIIGIDELDKLRSPDSVEDFLNDIKGIFGAPGCFYLVSVSEDAAANFGRRGSPFRDVFDSSFDDVISVQYLDLKSARTILYGLASVWTKPFVALCYVLSGGLARDLLRCARDLVAARNARSEIDLAAATLMLCQQEGRSRLEAIQYEVLRKPFDPLFAGLQNKIAGLTPVPDGPAEFRSWHDQLQRWVLSTTSTATPASTATPPSSPGMVVPGMTTPLRVTRPARLALELAAFALFAATVLEFFDPATIADRLKEAENPGTHSKSITVLAKARQSLVSSPHVSLDCIKRFRDSWSL